jgi:Kef-type K+ transport system membrane component KefB
MMNILFHLLLLVAFTKLSYGYHKLNHPIVRQKDISVLGKDMKSTRLKCHTIESIVSLTCLSDSFPLAIDLPEINLVDETSALSPLGNDLLVFLFATIGIVPLFKWLNASPVIGFLVAGLLMGPAGLHLFSDLNDMESIADFGVLFLLFEQGLELTVERLQGLSKFAFGMGTLQVLLCSAAFFVFPFIGGVQFLEFFVGAQPNLVDITRIDEALVIGVALSLSSSAFCLKILQEKKQLSTTHGAAALGILLLQDIAVVPLLVLLPIIESSVGPMTISDQVAVLGATFAKALFGLGGILLFGGR